MLLKFLERDKKFNFLNVLSMKLNDYLANLYLEQLGKPSELGVVCFSGEKHTTRGNGLIAVPYVVRL